jgi:hypothetical protein
MDTLFSSSPRTILDQASRTWRQPQELSGSRPREVGLTGRGKFMAGAACIMTFIGLTVGIVLYVKFSRDWEIHKQVVQSGVNTEAVITRHWISKDDKLPYHFEYEYQVEGKTYHGQCSVNYKSWPNLEKEGRIRARYLPADPAKHSTPGHDPELPKPWLAILFAGAFFLWSGIVVRAIVLQYQVLAEGLCAPAVVVRIRRTDKLWQKIAYYAFVGGNGALVKGKTGPRTSHPSLGTIINIVYKPEHEKQNAPYPASLVRLKNYR